MIIDIPGQFRNLCQSYSRCIDLTNEQMLEIVESRLDGCRHRAVTRHWAYEGPVAFEGLKELRNALLAECGTERVAA